jgi:hypothetical protein
MLQKTQAWLHKSLSTYGSRINSAQLEHVLRVMPEIGKFEIRYLCMCLYGRSGELEGYDPAVLFR